MDVTSFYRDVDPQFCQGDILKSSPSLLLKDQPHALRKVTLPKDRIVYELEDLATEAPSMTTDFGLMVPAHCQVGWAMLLTHDCEIDKDQKHRTLAMIRSLPAAMPEKDRTVIQLNQRFPFFHLPATADLPESYVDFRRLSTVSPECVNTALRIASLSTDAKQAMLLQFFRFIARIQLKPSLFTEGA